MVRPVRDANSYTEVEFPIRIQIQVDSGHELLLLLADGIKAGDAAGGSVILKTAGDFFRKAVSDFDTRLEVKTYLHSGSMPTSISGRIKG